MVHSMTGFARDEANFSWGSLSCEMRSVNHRFLEPHLRLPELLRPLEPELRARLRGALQRGKVEIAFQLAVDESASQSLTLNLDLAEKLAEAVRQVDAMLDSPAPASAIDILQWPGVLDSRTLDREEAEQGALSLFNSCLQQLNAHRAREGAELVALIEQRLDAILVEVEKVRSRLPLIMQAQRDKLVERIEALKSEVNPERLEQELVFYAHRADVEEEMDRLRAHVNEVRRALEQGGAIGRRLDFLMQELNREANTLASKSMAVDTTQSAVELKILIEQIREQVQNIE